MAFNSFFEIPKWQSPELDPDAAGLVAAEPSRRLQQATRIVIADGGHVEFKEEVVLNVVRGRNLDLRLEPLNTRRPPQLANTIEVRCLDSKCSTDQTAVISTFPYG